jgi:hypothetical protein
MSAYAALIAKCLETCREGRHDNAYHALIEADDAILPEIIRAFRTERDPNLRGFLVEMIWQHRQLSTIPFLDEVLRDSDPAVWKQALDGLVTLASPAALDVLQAARDSANGELRDWIDEALEQTEARCAGKEL